MQDLELHINYVVGLAKILLMEQKGEFYPLCTYVDKHEQLIPLSFFDGDEHPSSSDLIQNFHAIMQPKLENDEITSYVVAFDCIVKRFENSEKENAIAIHYSHRLKPETTYYYPYSISNNELTLLEPWGIINE